jgi:hypothetical protein
MITLALKLAKNLRYSNNNSKGFDFLPAVELTSAYHDGTNTDTNADTTIDTDYNGGSDTTSMLAQFVVICFCLQFVIIIIFVFIVSIMPSLQVPPTPNIAAISSLSSVTTSSQPITTGTNLEALINDPRFGSILRCLKKTSTNHGPIVLFVKAMCITPTQ